MKRAIITILGILAFGQTVGCSSSPDFRREDVAEGWALNREGRIVNIKTEDIELKLEKLQRENAEMTEQLDNIRFHYQERINELQILKGTCQE